MDLGLNTFFFTAWNLSSDDLFYSQSGHCVLQYFVASRLSSACWTNQHDTKSDIESFKQLNGLERENSVLLQIEVNS